jgi:hypothetical protein
MSVADITFYLNFHLKPGKWFPSRKENTSQGNWLVTLISNKICPQYKSKKTMVNNA